MKRQLAMGIDSTSPMPIRDEADVKIVWKGRRIAKLVFPSGKIVEFDEVLGFSKPRVINGAAEDKSHPSKPSSRGV